MARAFSGATSSTRFSPTGTVAVLDNFGSGQPENFTHVESDRLDIRDHGVREPLPDVGSDIVYHFASRGSPKDFASPSRHRADERRRHAERPRPRAGIGRARRPRLDERGVRRSGVHPQLGGVQRERERPRLQAPYDASKRYAEALVVAYEAQYDLDVRTLRIFTATGRGCAPTTGVSFRTSSRRRPPMTT